MPLIKQSDKEILGPIPRATLVPLLKMKDLVWMICTPPLLMHLPLMEPTTNLLLVPGGFIISPQHLLDLTTLPTFPTQQLEEVIQYKEQPIQGHPSLTKMALLVDLNLKQLLHFQQMHRLQHLYQLQHLHQPQWLHLLQHPHQSQHRDYTHHLWHTVILVKA